MKAQEYSVEARVRELVSLTTGIKRTKVFVAPAMNPRPVELHAVVDMPVTAPESGNGVRRKGYDEENEREWLLGGWKGAVRVRFQGPGAGSAARNMFMGLHSDSYKAVESAWCISFDTKDFNVNEQDEIRGDATVAVSEVRCGVAWSEYYYAPVPFYVPGDIGIGLDLDSVPKPLHETI